MEELHARQLRQMRLEHERKKAADEEKLEALQEQKRAACEQFEETIRQVKVEQDDLMERMSLGFKEEL